MKLLLVNSGFPRTDDYFYVLFLNFSKVCDSSLLFPLAFCFPPCLFLAINNSQRSKLRGTLHLVDLAGSERVGRSNAKGDRLNETKAINTSLSALSGVFVSIANKSSHVSGRTLRRPSRCFGDFCSMLLFSRGLSPLALPCFL